MSSASRFTRKFQRGAAYARRNGLTLTTARVLLGAGHALAAHASGRDSGQHPKFLVRYEDAISVDWLKVAPWATHPKQLGAPEQTTVSWITSVPGESSGGHGTMFRFISFLESAGYQTRVYLYSADSLPIDIDHVRTLLRTNPAYSVSNASIDVYDPAQGVSADTDVIVATGWETAYPAYLDKSLARRLYFVQDFEPDFYPVGSDSVLAENTYHFGFRAMTAGGWLAHKLHADYGMMTRSFPFGSDPLTYQRRNTERRSDIFFYARPVTPRRGFELGVLILDEVKRRRPDITIHMAGWDVSDRPVPFDYVNHGILTRPELAAVYNRCAAALVMSLTNMSLLPLELLGCGTIPVVNDADNNRMVSDNPFIDYMDMSPASVANRLIEILDNPDQTDYSRQAAQSIDGVDWDVSRAIFLKGFQELLQD